MTSDIDVHQAIRVFQLIREHGEKIATGFQLNGVTGTTDFDGYTVFLNDDKVSLVVYFHYKYKLEYDNPRDLESFINRLDAIEKEYFPINPTVK
jgi:hypothetical protein